MGSHEIDLGPWVGAPPEDQSPDADFRREVAQLTRDVLASLAANDATAANAANAADDADDADDAGAAGGGAVAELSRAHFDLRTGTPYLLARAYRTLAERVAPGGGPAIVRDLALLEIARRRPISPGALRRRLGIPASTLAGVLKASEQAGMLRRRRHPGDGRTRLIEPTPAGLERAAEVARVWRAADEALLAVMSPGEQEHLCRLLRSTAALARPRRPHLSVTHD